MFSDRMLGTNWASVGAAVAVTLGAGGIRLANAQMPRRAARSKSLRLDRVRR